MRYSNNINYNQWPWASLQHRVHCPLSCCRQGVCRYELLLCYRFTRSSEWTALVFESERCHITISGLPSVFRRSSSRTTASLWLHSLFLSVQARPFSSPYMASDGRVFRCLTFYITSLPGRFKSGRWNIGYLDMQAMPSKEIGNSDFFCFTAALTFISFGHIN